MVLTRGGVGEEWGLFAIAVILAIISAIVWENWGKGKYEILEKGFKVILLLVAISVIGIAAINISRNPKSLGEMLINAINIGNIPPGLGIWDAAFLAVGIIGAVGGSVTNLFYSYYVREKKWIGEHHIKLIRFDLGLSILVIIFINACLWTLGAEVLRPLGIEVKELTDIAYALEYYFGIAGRLILLLGFFSAAYSTFIGCAQGLSMLTTDSLHVLMPERKQKYDHYTKDPIFRYLLYFGILSPILWSYPGMPGMVWLVIFGNATSVFVVPLIALGVLIITNKKDFIGEHKTHPILNIILLFAVAITLWSAYRLVLSLI